MKDFDIFGVHWKIRFLGEGGEVIKNQYIGGGGDCLGGGAWQEWGGLDTPMHTMDWLCCIDATTLKLYENVF